jgi:hypothetical protein
MGFPNFGSPSAAFATHEPAFFLVLVLVLEFRLMDRNACAKADGNFSGTACTFQPPSAGGRRSGVHAACACDDARAFEPASRPWPVRQLKRDESRAPAAEWRATPQPGHLSQALQAASLFAETQAGIPGTDTAPVLTTRNHPAIEAIREPCARQARIRVTHRVLDNHPASCALHRINLICEQRIWRTKDSCVGTPACPVHAESPIGAKERVEHGAGREASGHTMGRHGRLSSLAGLRRPWICRAHR